MLKRDRVLRWDNEVSRYMSRTEAAQTLRAFRSQAVRAMGFRIARYSNGTITVSVPGGCSGVITATRF